MAVGVKIVARPGSLTQQMYFPAIAEGMGGFRYVNGFPDRPPVRPNLSIGDTIASLHGVIGALMALHSGKGQVVDVALYEAMFNCMESLIADYDGDGYVRERTGSTLPGIAPSNLYPCKEGYVLIAGNADSLYYRLMSATTRRSRATTAAPRRWNASTRLLLPGQKKKTWTRF